MFLEWSLDQLSLSSDDLEYPTQHSYIDYYVWIWGVTSSKLGHRECNQSAFHWPCQKWIYMPIIIVLFIIKYHTKVSRQRYYSRQTERNHMNNNIFSLIVFKIFSFEFESTDVVFTSPVEK